MSFKDLKDLLGEYHTSSIKNRETIEDSYATKYNGVDSNTDKYDNNIEERTGKYIIDKLYNGMKEGKMKDIGLKEEEDVKGLNYKYYKYYTKKPETSNKTFLLIGESI
jgi:hypothetical protein